MAQERTPCLPTFRAAEIIASTSEGRKYSLSRSDDCLGGGVERVNFAENGTWSVTIKLGQSLNQTYLSLVYFA